MEIKTVQIGRIKNNDQNPRRITDESFARLVQSIKDMPSMHKIREIVVDKDMVTLGGNQRLQAYKEAGFKQVVIKKVTEKDFEEEMSRPDATWENVKKEFIVKDNVEFGRWAKDLIVEFGYDFGMEDWGVDDDEWDEDEPIIFEPNVSPTSSSDMITQEQLDKKDEMLKAQMMTEKTLKTVACPHCYEQFEIDQ